MNWSKTINSYQIIKVKKNQEIKNSSQIIIDIVICWYTTVKFFQGSSDRLGNGGRTETNGERLGINWRKKASWYRDC